MATGQEGAPGRRAGPAPIWQPLPPTPSTVGLACLPTCPLPPPQENRLAQHTIQALQSELDSLRADNIKLFEKIKFLQSYPGRVSALPDCGPRRTRQGERPTRPTKARELGAVTCWAALGLGAPRGHPVCPAWQLCSLS